MDEIKGIFHLLTVAGRRFKGWEVGVIKLVFEALKQLISSARGAE